MSITADNLKKAFGHFAEAKKDAEAERLPLDVGKVSATLIEEAAGILDAEGDPVEKFEGLCKRVDEIDAMLADVEEDEAGNVFVKVADGDVTAREFALASDKRCKEKEKGGRAAGKADEAGGQESAVAKAASMYRCRWSGNGKYAVVLATEDTIVKDDLSEIAAEQLALKMNMEEVGKLAKVEDAGKPADADGEARTAKDGEAWTGKDGEAQPAKDGETQTAKSENEDVWPEDMAPAEAPILKSERLTERERFVSTDPSERERKRRRMAKRDRAEAKRKGEGLSERSMV